MCEKETQVGLRVANLIMTYSVAKDRLLLLVVLLGRGSLTGMSPLNGGSRVWPAPCPS